MLEDPKCELKPSWRAAPLNGSLYFYTGRNSGPERGRDCLEVTQQGRDGLSDLPRAAPLCLWSPSPGVGPGAAASSSSLPGSCVVCRVNLPFLTFSFLPAALSLVSMPLGQSRETWGNHPGATNAPQNLVCFRCVVCACVYGVRDVCACVVCVVSGVHVRAPCTVYISCTCICMCVHVCHECARVSCMCVFGEGDGDSATGGFELTPEQGHLWGRGGQSSQQSPGLRKLSEIGNHCFLAGCLPSLIQVAITRSEYLAPN